MSNNDMINTSYVLMNIENENLVSTYNNNIYRHNHEQKSGFDLISPYDIQISPFGSININFKLKLCVFEHIYDENNNIKKKYISFNLYPYSNIGRTPIRLSNGISVIESNNRDTISCTFDNISNKSYTIKKYEPLLTVYCPTLKPLNIKTVEDISLNVYS